MKTIEEKARAYDEIIKKANKMHHENCEACQACIEELIPELAESEDEKIRKEIIELVMQPTWKTEKEFHRRNELCVWLEKQCEQKPIISNNALREGITHFGITQYQIDNWLKKYVDVEKQGEQNPTQETEPFEAEHGKYYYCIKDYFCGGRKQASKGDVIQALRGLPIMGLKDASEYFLPVNFIKCYSTWSEEDEYIIEEIEAIIDAYVLEENNPKALIDWLKSLRPQNRWKPNEEQMDALRYVTNFDYGGHKATLVSLYNDLKRLLKI